MSDTHIIEHETAFIKDKKIFDLINNGDFSQKEETDIINENSKDKRYRYIVKRYNPNIKDKETILILDSFCEPSDKNNYMLKNMRIICRDKKFFDLLSEAIVAGVDHTEDDFQEIACNNLIPGGLTSIKKIAESLNLVFDNISDKIVLKSKDIQLHFTPNEIGALCSKIAFKNKRQYNKIVAAFQELGVNF